MRLLVNHDPEVKGFLPNLIGLMREHDLTGIASSTTYTQTKLQEVAKSQKVDGILLCNTGTLQECLGKKATLANYRGSRVNYPIPAIVCAPLDHIRTVSYGRWLLAKDMEKFRRIKDATQPFSFTIADNHLKLEQLRQTATYAFLISFDIETDSCRRITCISFTILSLKGEVSCWVIPFFDFGVCHYQEDKFETHCYAVQTLREVLDTPAYKVGFNGKYDALYCITYGAYPRNFILDPMILGWAKESELPRALDFCASLHCYDYFAWKHEASEAYHTKDVLSYWAYCAKDSWYTLRCLLSQLSDLSPGSYEIFNYKKTFKLCYPAIYCELEGFLVDQKKQDELKAKAEAEKERLFNNLKVMAANPNFNPGSWQQVNELLYKTVGAKHPGVKQYGPAGTSEPALNRVGMQHPLLARIAGDIIKYREAAKDISTYYNFEKLNGRLVYAIDPSGTESSRFASQASSFWYYREGMSFYAYGTQVQNQPRERGEIKEQYIADEGFTLVEIDKSKSEARCVAYMAQCLALIEALEDPEKDFYKVLSALFFGMPYEEVSQELRNGVTKKIIHGSNYMLGAETFIDTAKPAELYRAMSLLRSSIKDLKSFAAYLLSLYHKPFPELRTSWYPAIRNEIASTGFLETPDGWKRHFFGNPFSDQRVLRQAIAHAPQRLSVGAINEAFWDMYTQLVIPGNGDFRLKAQIHDSIFAQVRTSLLDIYIPRMIEIAESKVCIVHGRLMKIPCEVKVGKSWGTMKTYHTPKIELIESIPA